MVDTVITGVDSIISIKNQLICPTVDDSITRNESGPQPKILLSKRKKCIPSIPVKPKRPLKPTYFTSNCRIKEESGIVEKPYIYPRDLETFAHKVMNKAWRDGIRKEELRNSFDQKHTIKTRMAKDLLNRLYVEEPKYTSMKTIPEVDSHFFQDVQGRPINDKIDLRSYIDYNRALLRTKVVDGWRKDEIMIIEEQLILEQNMITKIQENFKIYVDQFEQFLMRDHVSALQLLKESDGTTQEYFTLIDDLKREKKKNSAAVSAAYKCEDIWMNCREYQEFLYAISPITWKKDHPINNVESLDGEPENLITQRFSRVLCEANTVCLYENIQMFKDVSEKHSMPALYFTSPDQLMHIFRFMEIQNLNSLLYSEQLAVPLQALNDNMRQAEDAFDKQIQYLKEIIDGLEGGILWEEDRANYLENLGHNLINQEFKQLITDREILELFVFVEDVYENKIGPNDANLSMLDMMNAIGQKYRQEMTSFDQVPSDQIAFLEGNIYNEQSRIMKLAEKAARQNAEYERMTIGLNKAFAPPYQKSSFRQPVKRSNLLEHKEVPAPPPRELTEEEEEYLEFFTDYCELTDDPRDYGIDTVARLHHQEKDKHKETSAVNGRGITLFPKVPS